MKSYLKLLRIKHYFKNFLIFSPLFFGAKLLDINLLLKSIYSFIPFCLGTSVIYIINDIKDVEKDKRHPIKCKRPIASGEVSISSARILCVVVFLITIMCSVAAVVFDLYHVSAIVWLAAYMGINLMYSTGLKNLPVLDVLILAIGFIIRVYYGSCVTGIAVSEWLYLTVLGGSFYLGMGKRRNELKNSGGDVTRSVLKKYNYEFLDKNMYVCIAFTEVCYALWTAQSSHKYLMWTIPIIMVIFMKYSLDIEMENSEGNPIDVLLGDKVMMGLVMLYVAIVFVCIYYL